MNWGRHGMLALLALIVLLILFGLERRNKSRTSAINFDDLLLDQGKMSKSAAVMFGSFALTSWTIIYLTVNDKLTETYFTAYIAAWVVPAVAKIFKGPSDPVPGSTTTVTATETVTK